MKYAVLLILCGCVATKPKGTLPPMPPVFKTKAKAQAIQPFAPPKFRVVWDDNADALPVVYVLSFSTNLTDWADVKETEAIEFPFIADQPQGFYRIGARWK